MMQTSQRFVRLGVGDPGSRTAPPHPFHSLGPLIGRSSELAALRRRVTESPVRMVALTGPVGVGKSRLAAAVFDEACTGCREGWLADLAMMEGGDGLPERLVEGLGCPGDEDEPALARLAAWWGERDVLLVLDHWEQLMDDVVGLVPLLLAECPGLRVLVVGQEIPKMYGQTVFSLAPLAVPEQRSPATLEQLSRVASIELLLHRTSVVRPGFALTDENREVVVELCRRLDGLPLAIELAAARLKLLTPGALLGELDEDLDCLHGGGADTLSRYLSMPDALAHSCDRLSQGERARFFRLSVFGGEFGITAAEAMMRPGDGSVQELLATLVDRNLLVQMERADGELGFSMLGTVRVYALSRLDRMDELEQVKQDHAAHFLEQALLAEQELHGLCQGHWTEQLALWDRELQRGLAYFLERGRGQNAAAFAAALRPYWLAVGRLREGHEWLELVLAEDDVSSELRAKTLEAAGELGAWLRCDSAVERLRRARAIYQRLSDDRGAAACLHHLGMAAYLEGELGKAAGLLQEAVDARRGVGDAHGHACAVRDLAALRLDVGDPAEARSLAEAAARRFSRLKDARRLALTEAVLGAVAAEEGDLAEAEELAGRVLRFFASGTDPIAAAGGLELAAHLLSKHGRDRERWRRCTLLLAAAHELRTEAGCELSGHRQARRDDLAERARVRLGGSAFENDWAEGRALPLRGAVERALAPPRETTAADGLDVGLPTPLTPREHEVAELVARGLTNRAIARRLGIAEWTAVNHLRKIMRKLDCSSRVQVANWVANRQTEESAVDVPRQRRTRTASAVAPGLRG